MTVEGLISGTAAQATAVDSGLESAEAPPVVDEGAAPGDTHVVDCPYDQLMVTGVVGGHQAALQPGQDAVEKRRPVAGDPPADAGELVPTGHGEVTTQGLLVLGQ